MKKRCSEEQHVCLLFVWPFVSSDRSHLVVLILTISNMCVSSKYQIIFQIQMRWFSDYLPCVCGLSVAFFIINNGKPKKDNEDGDICDNSFLVQSISC